MQVTLQSLSTSEGVELLIKVTDEYLTWETDGTAHTDRTSPLGDLSRWFSVTVRENGTINNVYLPSDEKRGIAAFKKSLAQLLVLSDGGDVERKTTSSGGLKITERTTREKNTLKVNTNYCLCGLSTSTGCSECSDSTCRSHFMFDAMNTETSYLSQLVLIIKA